MASMTRSALRTQVRRLGRVGSNVADSILDTWLFEAVKQFQTDVLWLEQTRHYYVVERFDIGTTEGLGVRLTTATGTLNIFGSDTAYSNLTGSSMAQLMSTAWENEFEDTGIYFTWSTANLKFSVLISTLTYDSTGLFIGPPAYSTKDWLYDYSYKMFNITAETSADATSYTGSIPERCTSEYPLPPDFLYVKEARYSNKSYPLKPTIFKSRDDAKGVPSHYYIRGNWIGVTPQPTDGGRLLRLDYYYEPTDFVDNDAVQPFPAEFDFALIWYAIYLYKNNQDDTQGELKALAKYEQRRLKAVQRKNARVGGAIDLQNRGRDYDVRRYNI